MTPLVTDRSILVTGANGFVGQPLCALLEERGSRVRRIIRRPTADSPADAIAVGDIDAQTDWSAALQNVDAVIHLAARVHVMQDTAANSLEAFRLLNVYGTEKLARAAAAAGVRRFIYVSSIKVNGEQTAHASSGFTEADPPNPLDPYGVSKWEAEQMLRQISAQTGIEVVIVRPPLVYGPRVKGNFASLLHWVARGIPLPLASIRNRRSLIGVDNLADFLVHCLSDPRAANETFLVCDSESLSTPDLIRHLAAALDKPARLVPFPEAPLWFAARILGREPVLTRLFGSLMIDAAKARQKLDWKPPFSVDEGLRKAAQWITASSPGTDG